MRSVWCGLGAALACACAAPAARGARAYCQPSDSACWPTSGEVSALRQTLEPTLERKLVYAPGQARVMSTPVFSPEDQPLYGVGVGGLAPLYVRGQGDAVRPCFTGDQPLATAFCLVRGRGVAVG
jgi:hypothetical protein